MVYFSFLLVAIINIDFFYHFQTERLCVRRRPLRQSRDTTNAREVALFCGIAATQATSGATIGRFPQVIMLHIRNKKKKQTIFDLSASLLKIF